MATSSISSTSSLTGSTSSSSTSAASSAVSSLFQASGLASGINTSSIVDALIAADSGQLNALKQRQSDYQVQISTLGTLVSQLQALQTAAGSIATNGVASIQPDSTYTDFSVTGSAKSEGTYTIQVSQLARAAKIRSTNFSSAQDDTVVNDGILQFSIDGTATAQIDTTGKGLADIAEEINDNIPGLNASVISTGTQYYLTVARSSTGYAQSSGTALTVLHDPGLGFNLQQPVQTAQNAAFKVDGLDIQRTSNSVSDVIPGVTLHLNGQSNVANTVNFVANSSGTEAALNTFLQAYNTLATTVRGQLVTDPNQSYGDTLVDHSVASVIQNAMQAMLSQPIVATGSVRTLTDLGFELQNDGTLFLNTLTMNNAIQANPAAANAIFNNSTAGIGHVVQALVDQQTNSSTGALVQQQGSLKDSISEMDTEESDIQDYLDAERQRLTEQFTNMETLISGYSSATSYLSQWANLKAQ